jgi:hypothetical protein
VAKAGVRFVTLTYGELGSITTTSTPNMQDAARRPFDRAFAALIRDLDRRGLLASTLVCVGTEYGRTPKINPTAGRDHGPPRALSIVTAGGGIKRRRRARLEQRHRQRARRRSAHRRGLGRPRSTTELGVERPQGAHGPRRPGRSRSWTAARWSSNT